MRSDFYKLGYIFFLNLSIITLLLMALNQFEIITLWRFLTETLLFSALVISIGLYVLFKSKFNEAHRINSKSINSFFHVAPYFFLAILIILAINQFAKLEIITLRNVHLTVLGIFFGFFAFYSNRDRIEHELEDEKQKKYFYIIALMLLLFWVVRSLNILPLVRMSIEEGTYLYTGLLVFKGYIPIVDFFNGPGIIWPYIYGFLQFIFGQSLILGRITSFIFALLSVILVFLIIRKIYSLKVASISICFLVSFLTLHHQIISNSYALASFFALLSIFVYLRSHSNINKESLSVILMSVSVGVRITMIFALFFLLIIHYLSNKNLKRLLFLIFISFITGFIIFGIIFLINPKLFLFNVFGRVSVPSELFLTAYKPQLNNAIQIKIEAIKELMIHYPLDFLSVVLFTGILSFKAMIKDFAWFKKTKTTLFFYFSILGIMFISLLPPVTNYLMYVLVVPFGAILNSYFIDLILKRQKSNINFVILLFSLSILLIFTIDMVSQDPYLYKNSPIKEIEDVGKYIKQNTPEDSKLLTFYMPLNIASHRDNYINLNRGYFSYYPFVEFERANDLKVMSTEELITIIESKNPSAIALDKLYFYDRISLDKEQFDLIIKKIGENYALKKEFFVQGIGKIEIYLRKT